MELDGIRIEQDGTIARVVIDRPPVNAVPTTMYESMVAVFGDLDARKDVDVVVLCSAHAKIFCAGADIKELEQIVNSATSELDERRQRLAREAYDALLNLAQPTIAAINGPALGAGAVLSACCDVRIGSSKATIGLPEINVARCGGGRHMMRILPQGVVRRMYFTGQPLDAEAAHHFGVLDQVVEPGQELDAAMELARVIASKSPYALRIAKQALNASESMSIADGYPVEQRYTLELARSEDAREAARAFLEKREPVWAGR
jgi:enoyl-CoA hydratase/carnithine racemase